MTLKVICSLIAVLDLVSATEQQAFQNTHAKDTIAPNDEVVREPPIFPMAFNVSFSEISVLGSGVLGANTGAWYYDFTNRNWRVDHGRGQSNKYCTGQGEDFAPCQLFFTPKQDLIVNFPESGFCCRLCGTKEGCTILTPTWIKSSGAKINSQETINGVQCYGFEKPNSTMFQDNGSWIWYADQNGTPCRYYEEADWTIHNMTFHHESYKIGPQNPDLFKLPADKCNTSCPQPHFSHQNRTNIF